MQSTPGKIPDWTPKPVRALWQERYTKEALEQSIADFNEEFVGNGLRIKPVVASSDREDAAMLYRICTDLRMKAPLNAMNKKGKDGWFVRIFAAACNARNAYLREKGTKTGRSKKYATLAKQTENYVQMAQRGIGDFHPVKPQLNEACKILKEVANSLRAAAETAMIEPRLLKRPGQKKQKQRAFAAQLAPFFCQEFRTVNYKTLATFVNVALGVPESDDISGGTVRHLSK